MYQFWYDYIKVKYANKIKLIYTDTDSFVIEVETDDIYKDMYEDSHLYDFSEYNKNHPNFSLTNKQVLEPYSSLFPAVFGKTKSRCST